MQQGLPSLLATIEQSPFVWLNPFEASAREKSTITRVLNPCNRGFSICVRPSAASEEPGDSAEPALVLQPLPAVLALALPLAQVQALALLSGLEPELAEPALVLRLMGTLTVQVEHSSQPPVLPVWAPV